MSFQVKGIGPQGEGSWGCKRANADWNQTVVQLWYVVYLLFFFLLHLFFPTSSSFLLPSLYPYSSFTIIRPPITKLLPAHLCVITNDGLPFSLSLNLSCLHPKFSCTPGMPSISMCYCFGFTTKEQLTHHTRSGSVPLLIQGAYDLIHWLRWQCAPSTVVSVLSIHALYIPGAQGRFVAIQYASFFMYTYCLIHLHEALGSRLPTT
ncbi:hypothetical protein R3P38DRAFT_2860272 [Favolaschia claudopus]|uniref:Uncharacterized protein n=1 Tax=Favolaschia claudopus TaxID=2862362 RepID=A0AAW0DIJ3_9AGAR